MGPGQEWETVCEGKMLALDGAGQTSRLSAQMNKNPGEGRHSLPLREASFPTTSLCKAGSGRKSPCVAREPVMET